MQITFHVRSNNHKFDVLIFTQQWPVTTCIEWKDQNPQHSCLLPSPKEMWTIHGVWPTLLGTIGPSFCNKTAVFDPTQLAPFEDQLEQFWINIEKGAYASSKEHPIAFTDANRSSRLFPFSQASRCGSTSG